MTDNEIIDLYWDRNERAISETDAKYGKLCRSLSFNILNSREDAEECVNDTYHKAWTQMPPQRPEKLRAWLGRIVRNISFNLWNKQHTKKHGGGMDIMLSELEECIPSGTDVEDEIDDIELGRVISAWLHTLSDEDRIYFVLRYWNGEPLKNIAGHFGISANTLAKKMHKLRIV